MFDIHISSDATVTGWRLLGEIEVFVTALAGSRLPAAMVTVSYGNRKQRSLAFSVKRVPFHMSVALRQNFHLCFFPRSASSRQVFGDKLASSMETMGNQDNLLSTRVITRRFLVSLQLI